VAQPFANHNGGNLVFGPDGFLYIGLGDGGSGDDPDHRAQNPASLLGKMLRIDVNLPESHPVGYVVPASNPFATGAMGARPEIWSFGLRNPWRYSFDDPSRGGTGALVLADVGQNAWEEGDYEPAGRGGRNYGWRNREGAHANVGSRPPAYLPLVDPIHEYNHSVGSRSPAASCIGAPRSGPRGAAGISSPISSRAASGRSALSIAVTGEAAASRSARAHRRSGRRRGQLAGVSSFGVDSDGELYIVSYRPGRHPPAQWRHARQPRPDLAHHPREARESRRFRLSG
jgi:hypothetical protein